MKAKEIAKNSIYLIVKIPLLIISSPICILFLIYFQSIANAKKVAYWLDNV
jgi:hypothetical protein